MSASVSLYEVLLTEFDGIEKDGLDFTYLFAESVLYLTGGVSAFQYQHAVKPFCSEYNSEHSAKDFRLMLLDSHYSLLLLKLFCLRLAQQRVTEASVASLAEEYGIVEEDATFVRILFQNCVWFRKDLRLAAQKVVKGHHLLKLAEIHSLFNDVVYKPLLKYVKFFVYNKMRFIVNSQNLTFDDLHGDLMTKALQSYYSIVPVEATELHIVNYLKRAVHNHGINLIKSATSKKRGRLVRVSDDGQHSQFSLLCVSQNQVKATVGEDGTQVDLLESGDTSSQKFELSYSVSEVLDSVKATSRKYRLLTLLMGDEDPHFTEWLRQEGVAKAHEDNVDVQERSTAADFNRLVAEFLRVPFHKAESFLGSLRYLAEV